VRTALTEGRWSAYVAAKAQCTDSAEDYWLTDASGRIRSLAQPNLCLTASNDVSLSECDATRDAQIWNLDALPLLKNGNRCIDLAGGSTTGKLIMYGCHGGGNQQWLGLSLSDNALLPLLKARNVVNFVQFAQGRDKAGE